MKSHADRARDANAILARWRAEQGHKAARGVVEILRALENIAAPLAAVAAHADTPGRVILTHDQLRIGRQRAVSQARMQQHGAPPKQADAWWEQIAAIQQAWGIELTREQWTEAKPVKEAA